jgi:hypothetical protein
MAWSHLLCENFGLECQRMLGDALRRGSGSVNRCIVYRVNIFQKDSTRDSMLNAFRRAK